jgi:hypothetical protein
LTAEEARPEQSTPGLPLCRICGWPKVCLAGHHGVWQCNVCGARRHEFEAAVPASPGPEEVRAARDDVLAFVDFYPYGKAWHRYRPADGNRP